MSSMKSWLVVSALGMFGCGSRTSALPVPDESTSAPANPDAGSSPDRARPVLAACPRYSGSCVPVAGPGSVVVTLASLKGYSSGIAIDSSNVYFTDSTVPNEEGAADVMKVSLAGGPATLLAHASSASGIAVDDRSVYWTENVTGSVMKASLAGGAALTVASNQSAPEGVAVAGSDVYWVEHGGDVVVGLPSGQPDPFALATSLPTPYFLAVGATSVFWTTNADPYGGAVMSVPKTGGTSAPLALGGGPYAIATDGDGVYWTSSDGTSDRSGTVQRISSGVERETVASELCGPAFIAIDASSVYWTDDVSGLVMKVAKRGGLPTMLVSGLCSPTFIAVDGDSVYFTTGDVATGGAVMKVTAQ
jgi:hypothetical protein